MAHACLVHKGGGHADERRAALRGDHARQEVELAAGAADLAHARRLGVDLAVEIDGDAVADGDHVVVFCDHGGVVDEAQRLDDDAGVLVDPVVELLRAEDHARHALVPLEGLAPVRELAGLEQAVVGVAAELGVHAQILHVGLGQHGADDVRHRADAELQRRPAFDVRDQVVGDGRVLRGGGQDRELRQGRMLALNDTVDLGDVDALVKAAVDARQALVDLEDDDVGLFQNAAGHARAAGEVEVAVLVHGGDGRHPHVEVQKRLVIPDEVAEDHRREGAQPPVAELALVGGQVPARVVEVLPRRVALHREQRAEHQVAADLDAVQLIPAFGEGGVEQDREADVGAVVHPVAVLDELDGLVRGAELAAVFVENRHRHLSPPSPGPRPFRPPRIPRDRLSGSAPGTWGARSPRRPSPSRFHPCRAP